MTTSISSGSVRVDSSVSSELKGLTIEQAERIIRAHTPYLESVSSLVELHRSAITASFLVSLEDETTFVVKISSPSPIPFSSHVTRPIEVEATVLRLLSGKSSVPLPRLYASDTSCTLVPFYYLLLSKPEGSSLSIIRPQLTPQQTILVDLRTGEFLKQINSIDNDFFGSLCPLPGEEECYSWQEAFTLILETLLQDASDLGLADLPYERIRSYLSRAIGFFLFDDVEVPSLIWWDSIDKNIFVSSIPDSVDVSGLGNFERAIWGDPLMERIFSDPELSPSEALLEGYGGSMEVLPRHRTKKLWYTIYLALIQIVEGRVERKDMNEARGISLLMKTLDLLQDAPCY